MKSVNPRPSMPSSRSRLSATVQRRSSNLQLADFIGERLSGRYCSNEHTNQRYSRGDQDPSGTTSIAARGRGERIQRRLAATLDLLSDSVADYRKLLEQIFGDIDTAVEKVWAIEDFKSVLDTAVVYLMKSFQTTLYLRRF